MTEIPNPATRPSAEQDQAVGESEPEVPEPPVDPTSDRTAHPPPPHPGQIPMVPIKRLYRDPNGAIGGVMAGLAHYFGIDVTLARLAMVVFALLSGTGILAYIIAWIIVPEAPHPLFTEQPVHGPVHTTQRMPANDGVGV